MRYGEILSFFAFSVLLSIKIIKKRRMYMEYEAFKETLMDFLREKTGGEKSISLHRVEKNNGIELDALVVRGKRDKIAPMIYLKPFYVDFQGGLSMEEIAVQILQLSVTEKQEFPQQKDIRNNP